MAGAGKEQLTTYRGYEGRETEPKPFANTIIALDVDGVLVNPLAYREATRLTIIHFSQEIGVDPTGFMLNDKNRTWGSNMSHWEAEGIHDPWDVSAIIVSLMKLRKEGIEISNADALSAYQANQDKKAHPPEVIFNQLSSAFRQNFPQAMQEVSGFLSQTRNPFANPVTSIFQEYVLGEEIFERTYGKKGVTGAVESLIQTKDRSLITDAGRKELNTIAQGGGKVIIYTARPGLPPDDVSRKPADGYSPEAELAVIKSRVNTLGIVSMGSMEWLGRESNTPVQDLTKPNPTQALAAILSALRGKVDAKVLRDAYNWGINGIAPKETLPFTINKTPLNLVVAEDSPPGIRAFANAKDILQQIGAEVKLTAIGIHSESFEKHRALQQLLGNGADKVDTNSEVTEGILRYSYDIRSNTIQ